MNTSSDTKRQFTVSVIGTAGRGEDVSKMTKTIFLVMIECVRYIILHKLDLSWDQVHVKSGGAAWSDHIAVLLFLQHREQEEKSNAEKDETNQKVSGNKSLGPSLTLHLPCPFTSNPPAALDNGEYGWQANPGRVMNLYHQKFGKIMQRDTLADIARAAHEGAILDTSHSGFHARNTSIADCDILIALTWSDSFLEPKDGGTADTWRKATSAKRIHVPLLQLVKSQTMEELIDLLVVQRRMIKRKSNDVVSTDETRQKKRKLQDDATQK